MFDNLCICYKVWLGTKLLTLFFNFSELFLSLLFFAFVRQYKTQDILYTLLHGWVCICQCDWLIEVGFGNGEEAAVSLGPDSEYEGLPGQDSKLTDKLARVCHKQACLLLTVNHPLVNMEEARNHKLDAYLLKHQEEKERRAKIWRS